MFLSLLLFFIYLALFSFMIYPAILLVEGGLVLKCSATGMFNGAETNYKVERFF